VIAATWSTSDSIIGVGVLVLLFLSGFFAMAETSLIRMNKSRARALQEAHRHGAAALVALVEAPDSFLNPLLLLVLICQLVSATLVGVLAARLFGGAGVFVATVLEVIVIFVIFEAVPKNYAVQHPDRAALATAPVVKGLLKWRVIRATSGLLLAIAHAVIRLFGSGASDVRITDGEIIAMAEVAENDKTLEKEEADIIRKVVGFGDTIVREVMVPRIDIVDVDHDATVLEALRIAVDSGRSRLPVLGESIDDVIGIVNLRQLAQAVASGDGDARVSTIMKDVAYVPETKKLDGLLAEIQAGQVHIYVVVDEYGGTAGLVTLEDVLEELVGEITDESDKRSAPETDDETKKTSVTVQLAGRLNIDDVNEEYDLDLPTGSWDTIGGLLMDRAGGVPEVGDVFDFEQYRITVVAMDNRRVGEALIERKESL